MDTSIFESFKENILQKTKNPLLGTIIVVWTFKNWRLIYSLFNFEEEKNLDARIEYVERYFLKFDFYDGLISSVGYAFLALVVTYTLLAISRLIINFYDKIITPIIYKWTDKSSVVLKSDFDILLNENYLLDEKLKTERDNRLKVQAENESYEKKVYEVMNENSNLQELRKNYKAIETEREQILNERNKLSSTVTKYSKIEEHYNKIQKELSDAVMERDILIAEKQEFVNYKVEKQNLLKEINDLKNYRESFNLLQKDYEDLLEKLREFDETKKSLYPRNFDESTIRAIKKINNETRYYDFRNIGSQILNNEPIKRMHDDTRYFTSLGLITPVSITEFNNDYGFYDLTEKGRNVFEYFNEIKD